MLLSQDILRYLAILVVVWALLSVSSASADEFEAKVIGVTDGDTITVLGKEGPIKIRLANIDCPEHNQAFGQKAKLFTAECVFGQVVTVDSQGTDRYGRTIAEVLPRNGSMDLNHQLVANGYAWVYRKYCRDQLFYELEAKARSAHLGLWADKEPVAPWQFRHGVQNSGDRTTLNWRYAAHTRLE